MSTPAYCDLDIVSPVTVNVEVMAGSSRDPKCSEPVDFTYKPQVKVEPVHDMVACQGVTAQQDSNKQGGLVTTVMGGTNGVMMTSDFATAGNVLVGDQTPQLPEMAATSVLPALLLKADQNGEYLVSTSLLLVLHCIRMMIMIINLYSANSI